MSRLLLLLALGAAVIAIQAAPVPEYDEVVPELADPSTLADDDNGLAQVDDDEELAQVDDSEDEDWGFIKHAIHKVKRRIPKYVSKGRTSILKALDSVKARMKWALKRAKARGFGEELLQVDDSEDEDWGFIKHGIHKIKRRIPKYVSKGKTNILNALDRLKARMKWALKRAKARGFGEELLQVDDSEDEDWGFIKHAIHKVKRRIP